MERFGLLPQPQQQPEPVAIALPWVKIDAAQLQKHYYVSWPSLLAGDGKENGESEEEVEEAHEEGMEGQVDGVEKEGKLEEDEGKKQKRRKRKGKKKSNNVGDDYDFDDPFIDDDEAPHAVYESIFDLMAQASEPEPDDALEGIGQDQRRQRRQFYVFRGKLSTLQEPEGESDDPEAEKKKRSRRSSVSTSPKRKAKKAAEPAQSKPKKKARMTTEKKPTALALIMALDRGEDGEEAEEVELGADDEQVQEEKDSGSASQRPARGNSPLKQQRQVAESDRQYGELELRLGLEAFSTLANRLTGTFDPIKFPSALRGSLTDSVMARMRLSAVLGETADEMVNSLLLLFEKLATWVPYSGSSLRKLVMKRILPSYQEELETKRLVAHYQSITLITNQTVDLTLANPDLAKRPLPEESSSNTKFRVTEPLREVIYEIVRYEWDLSLIRRILRLFDEATAEQALVEPVESEHAHRKNVYVKIHRAWSDRWELTTYDISREYSNMKRKVERALMKRHGVEVLVRKRERKPKDHEPAPENADPAQVTTSILPESAIVYNEPLMPESAVQNPTVQNEKLLPKSTVQDPTVQKVPLRLMSESGVVYNEPLLPDIIADNSANLFQ